MKTACSIDGYGWLPGAVHGSIKRCSEWNFFLVHWMNEDGSDSELQLDVSVEDRCCNDTGFAGVMGRFGLVPSTGYVLWCNVY